MIKFILIFCSIIYTIQGDDPTGMDDFSLYCLKGSYQPANARLWSCTTKPSGVIVEKEKLSDNSRLRYCIRYKKKDGSHQMDSDTLEFGINGEFSLNYTGAIVYNRAEVGFVLRKDEKFDGKFLFEGSLNEFDISTIKVNYQKQVCKENDKQVFPDLGFFQRYFDKKREEEIGFNKDVNKKQSDDERRITCGYSKKINPRELDDNIVVPGKYPWLVAIRKKVQPKSDYQDEPVYLCAGTIINEDHIITTASCLHEGDRCLTKESLIIQTSPFQLSALNKDRPQTDFLEIEKITVHEGFNETSRANNLAVIKLKKFIVYNNYVLPSCYPTNNYNVITGQKGSVLGYGKYPSRTAYLDKNNKLIVRYDFLNKQALNELPTEVEYEVFHAEKENPSLFFAVKRSRDPIYPDEGSGFYVKRGKQWRVTGIMSHWEGKDNDGKEIFKFVYIENLRGWLDGKI